MKRAMLALVGGALLVGLPALAQSMTRNRCSSAPTTRSEQKELLESFSSMMPLPAGAGPPASLWIKIVASPLGRFQGAIEGVSAPWWLCDTLYAVAWR